MTKKITVENVKKQNPRDICSQLENGNILFFPKIPFDFPKEDIAFLLSQKQTASKARKNIAYKPQKDIITNFSKKDEARLHFVLKNYCYTVKKFLSTLLIPYKDEWLLDYTSFRPFQEKGRDLRLSARNDLLHIDAFPTRPMHGKRILRFFTNINPKEPRKWLTGKTFEELVEEEGPKIGYPQKMSHSLLKALLKKGKKKAKNIGLPLNLRSPYDEFMLKMHHHLKQNTVFQKEGKKDHWSFPPNSCWMVFTDQVTHAALSGQYALEQTFLVPRSVLVYPERCPLSVLERLTGYSAVDSEFV